MNKVPRCFPGDTIVILGGGPSLTQAEVDRCRGKARVIAIKEQIRLAPWADVFYAPDKKFFNYHGEEVINFPGLKFTLDHMVGDDTAVHLQIGDREGLSLDPTTLNTGYDSGYQCINLAVLLGAARVVLLGYDMQPGPNGESHGSHIPGGEHVWGTKPPFYFMLPMYPSLVEPLKQAGVEVINCSPVTALDVFPRQSLADALASCEALSC